MDKGWILVLGASSDIAKATAQRFAQRGFAHYLAGRNLDELTKDAADLALRSGQPAKAVAFDATAFETHADFYAALDPKPVGAICAVGYLGDQQRAQTDPDEARRIMDTNYSGCASILDRIAADFEDRGEGVIIGVSSVAGERGRMSNYCYGSAKAGFTAYLSGLRNRLSHSGVRVITIKPGFVATRMTEGMDLPPLITAKPEQTARDIERAWRKGKDVVYSRWFWRWIMLMVRNIPERLFKRLKL